MEILQIVSINLQIFDVYQYFITYRVNLILCKIETKNLFVFLALCHVLLLITT